jgi:hypothetical protein
MEDINTYLNELGIDTTSRIRGVQDAGALSFDENTYRRIIGELTGEEDVNVGDDYARMTFMYLIGDVLEVGVPNLPTAEAKAIEYVDAHPWILAKPEYEYEPKSKVDALGQPKQKKGAKKEAAIIFWNANQSKYSTRKEWIKALADNVGLTKAAASTYHHNLKKGIWK